MIKNSEKETRDFIRKIKSTCVGWFILILQNYELIGSEVLVG